jgi:hypothetical protein
LKLVKFAGLAGCSLHVCTSLATSLAESSPVSEGAASLSVILSEAKNLRLFLCRSAIEGHREMFRFAEHDRGEKNRRIHDAHPAI